MREYIFELKTNVIAVILAQIGCRAEPRSVDPREIVCGYYREDIDWVTGCPLARLLGPTTRDRDSGRVMSSTCEWLWISEWCGIQMIFVPYGNYM